MSDKDGSRNIVSRHELARLIADRKNDPPAAQLDHPKPNWVLDSEDPARRRMRMRERRIRYLTNRLDGAAKTMEREFDQNS